jgi:hypothetical protein
MDSRSEAIELAEAHDQRTPGVRIDAVLVPRQPQPLLDVAADDADLERDQLALAIGVALGDGMGEMGTIRFLRRNSSQKSRISGEKTGRPARKPGFVAKNPDFWRTTRPPDQKSRFFSKKMVFEPKNPGGSTKIQLAWASISASNFLGATLR